MRGSAWELKFDAERGLLGGFGGLVGRILRVWKALGGSKCRILRVWRGYGGLQILTAYAARVGLVEKNLTRAGGRVWKALGGSIYCILRVWKALGGSFCRVSRGPEAPGVSSY